MNFFREKNRTHGNILIISGVIFYLFLLANITYCDAQARQYQWVQNGGGTGVDQANSVINTAGNIWQGGKVSSGGTFKRSDGSAPLTLTNAGAYVAHYLNVKINGSTTSYGYVNWVK